MPGRAHAEGGVVLAVRRSERSTRRRRISGCEAGAGHVLAQLPHDTGRVVRSASLRHCRPNLLDRKTNWRMFRASPTWISPCGRLTYRQTRPVKRKPYDEIAASQQTLVCSCAGRGQDIENSRLAVRLQDGPRRRGIATSYQDGLGICAVIGLSQFVRSASGRG
jgi:hypothetical protein